MDYGHTNNSQYRHLGNQPPESFLSPNNPNNIQDQNNVPQIISGGEQQGNSQELGNRVLNTVQDLKEGQPIYSETPDASLPPNFGQVMDTAPAPIAPDYVPTINESTVGPSGDKISPESVAFIDHVIGEFGDTTKPLSDTYEEVVKAREVYTSKLASGGAK